VFNIGRLAHLSRILGVEDRVIWEVLDDFDSDPDALVHELTLWPADPSKKSRNVIAVRGRWRMLQQRLYRRLFLPRMKPSPVSHGGVKGRSATTNARAHIGNPFAFVADISSFFPSISCNRVNGFFLRQSCSYEVARILTRLCTYDFHLALGLITSPILANELLKPIDSDITKACKKIGLTYTRFVDDITISGKFDLEQSGLRGVVENIVNRNGFRLAKRKTRCGRLDEEITVTGVRLKKYHLDAPKEYAQELDRLIADHASLAQGGDFAGPLLMEGELFGKAHFVCTLNPGRRRSILGRLKTISWDEVMNNAVARGLVRRRSRLRRRGEKRPECTEQLPQVVAARRFQETIEEYARTATINPEEAPF
jgi:RNA-directed DNA polymerase